MGESFDAFISYSHEDDAWVLTLAENLHRAGIEVFLDEWEIGAGDVLVHQLERGLRESKNGVLVVSPSSVARPWVQEEYAAMVTRAVAGSQRLIPVLLGDVVLPPFAASRVWIDFRRVDGAEYERRVRQLVAALRGERRQRPPRDGSLVPQPGSAVRPEGARQAELRIGPAGTTLETNAGSTVAGVGGGLGHRLEEQLYELTQARRSQADPPPGAVATRAGGETGAAGETLHARLLELGAGMAEAFLPAPVRDALVAEVRAASDAGAALRLAVEVDDPDLVELPWEALVLAELGPGPLALHPRVELYRAVPGLGPTPGIQIPGPLRILVAIGSPDQGERGELLDYEAELARILDAVQVARQAGRAYVRVLNRGTVDELRAALAAERFHVLHLSCHARPGELVLEDAGGGPDPVTAEKLAAEVLVADRGVPLVVLAGCSTALAERAGTGGAKGDRAQGEQAQGEQAQGEAALPALARQLLGHGVPAVLAMNAAVTDPYASRLGAALYQELATQQRPEPLAALSQARRGVDGELRRAAAGSREARLGALAEWATPVLAVRGPSLPLFDPG